MIAVATTATEHRPDVAVDGLDLAERDLDVLEQMRFGEAPVEGEQVPELLTLGAFKVAPGAEVYDFLNRCPSSFRRPHSDRARHRFWGRAN